jgi:hypothetical protein
MNDITRQRLLGLVGQGELRKAIDELLKVDLNPGMKKEALAIAARYRGLQSRRFRGIFNFHEDTITENQIIASLIDLLHFPEDQVFPEERSIDQKVPVRVLYWKYVTYVAVVVGLLAGISTGIVNWGKIFGPREAFEGNNVTVMVHGPKGKDERILENRGVVSLVYGTAVVAKQIDSQGLAIFTEIPSEFFSPETDVSILFSDPKLEPIYAVHRDSTYHLKKGQFVPLEVALFHLDTIRGIVRDFVTGDPIDSVRVSVKTVSTYSDEFGEYLIVIPPGLRQQFQTIRAQKKGYQFYELQDVPVQTRAEAVIVMKPK